MVWKTKRLFNPISLGLILIGIIAISSNPGLAASTITVEADSFSYSDRDQTDGTGYVDYVGTSGNDHKFEISASKGAWDNGGEAIIEFDGSYTVSEAAMYDLKVYWILNGEIDWGTNCWAEIEIAVREKTGIGGTWSSWYTKTIDDEQNYSEESIYQWALAKNRSPGNTYYVDVRFTASAGGSWLAFDSVADFDGSNWVKFDKILVVPS